jgi:hypothetical protein
MPRRRRPGPGRHRLVPLAVALGLAVAGCARSAEVTLPGPESTTPPLARAQFLAQANEICRATTRAIAEQTEQTGSGNLDAGAGGDRQKLVDAIEPVARLALARLRNLTPPPEDAALVRAGLDAMQAAVDALRRDPAAQLDPVGLDRPDLFAYGLTGCFTNSS